MAPLDRTWVAPLGRSSTNPPVNELIIQIARNFDKNYHKIKEYENSINSLIFDGWLRKSGDLLLCSDVQTEGYLNLLNSTEVIINSLKSIKDKKYDNDNLAEFLNNLEEFAKRKEKEFILLEIYKVRTFFDIDFNTSIMRYCILTWIFGFIDDALDFLNGLEIKYKRSLGYKSAISFLLFKRQSKLDASRYLIDTMPTYSQSKYPLAINAIMHIENGREDNALKILNNLSIGKNTDPYLILLISVCFAEIKEYSIAIKYIKDLSSANRWMISAQLARAKIETYLHHWRKSCKYALRAINIYDFLPNGHLLLSMCYSKSNNIEEAKRECRIAMKQSNNSPESLFIFAYILLMYGPEDPTKYFKKALKGMPYNAEIHYGLGVYYWRIGKRQLAKKHLMKAKEQATSVDLRVIKGWANKTLKKIGEYEKTLSQRMMN